MTKQTSIRTGEMVRNDKTNMHQDGGGGGGGKK